MVEVNLMALCPEMEGFAGELGAVISHDGLGVP